MMPLDKKRKLKLFISLICKGCQNNILVFIKTHNGINPLVEKLQVIGI
ncbi:hypothetical protein C3B55_00347 [Candidatus Pseudomonas adelgestsugas]|uniref:Uncharacterized protein n=1 Tax=Candidatus Pseudomonas adelgestsugas TaxID=1302376 RepID=A0ABX5R7T0_9PSED|nr:hypothetical protein C3B55_00347 [Candidatus Pseudomonas adelgestsugas]